MSNPLTDAREARERSAGLATGARVFVEPNEFPEDVATHGAWFLVGRSAEDALLARHPGDEWQVAVPWCRVLDEQSKEDGA